MIREIRTVAVVSTGTIGAGWATHFLAKGYDVVATDPAESASALRPARLRTGCALFRVSPRRCVALISSRRAARNGWRSSTA